MANTKDLRYVRTESAIRSAFMELVAGKHVTQVTVSDICKHAGISRNAFYLHYAGVAALYASVVEELVADIRSESLASVERMVAEGCDDSLSAALIGALGRHEDMLRALLPNDDGSLAECLAEGIEDAFVDAALRFGTHGGSLDHRLRCAYTAWGIVGFVSRWIANTTKPIVDALPRFEEMQASGIEASVAFLAGERGGDSVSNL